jgi:hypothetical protein
MSCHERKTAGRTGPATVSRPLADGTDPARRHCSRQPEAGIPLPGRRGRRHRPIAARRHRTAARPAARQPSGRWRHRRQNPPPTGGTAGTEPADRRHRRHRTRRPAAPQAQNPPPTGGTASTEPAADRRQRSSDIRPVERTESRPEPNTAQPGGATGAPSPDPSKRSRPPRRGHPHGNSAPRGVHRKEPAGKPPALHEPRPPTAGEPRIPTPIGPTRGKKQSCQVHAGPRG